MANGNGFKICYREEGSYKQAVRAKLSYERYPPRARNDNHKLNNPTWKIIPINKDEVKAGIWREVPF